MDKKTNNNRDKNDIRKLGSRRNHYIGKNTMKWNKRTGST